LKKKNEKHVKESRYRERFLNANIRVHFYAPCRGVERRKPLSTPLTCRWRAKFRMVKWPFYAGLTYIHTNIWWYASRRIMVIEISWIILRKSKQCVANL